MVPFHFSCSFADLQLTCLSLTGSNQYFNRRRGDACLLTHLVNLSMWPFANIESTCNFLFCFHCWSNWLSITTLSYPTRIQHYPNGMFLTASVSRKLVLKKMDALTMIIILDHCFRLRSHQKSLNFLKPCGVKHFAELWRSLLVHEVIRSQYMS